MVKFNTGKSQIPIYIGGQKVDFFKLFFALGATAIGSEVVLGDQGGQTLAQLHDTSGATLKIISSSAQDAAGGTGATSVRVWGFDTNNYLMYEDIDPNGDTGATLVNTDWLTVFYVEVLTAGSGKKAAGNIHITNSAGDVYYLAIAANGYHSNYLNIYVPNGYIASYELDCWFTTATTNTDGVTINQYTADMATNEITAKIKSIAFSNSAALETGHKKVKGILKSGYHNIFKGVDIGTTAQTLNFNIKWGYLKI